MHAFLDNGSWVEWTGQRIDGVAHPRNILTLWQTAEIEAVGLYEVEIDPVPEGKIATSWALEDRAGRPAYVPVLVDYAPTSADVNAARDRRIATGTTFTVTGYGDVPLTGRAFDIQVYEGLRARAREAQAQSVTDPIFMLRDANNQNHTLTPTQLIELVDKATTWLQQTMAVSWAMKDGVSPYEAGIPVDYADNSHWPA